MLNRIARKLATRSGSAERRDELLDHLDQLEASGRTISLVDVGSLALLAIRSPTKSFLGSYVKNYIFWFAVFVGSWSIALAVGAIDSLERTIDRQFGLEEFEFVEQNLLVAFAVTLLVAVPACLVTIHLARRLTRKT